jgi:diguanylate cyclase (GGDEF)-like protein/PAS domain S-box-containing protein
MCNKYWLCILLVVSPIGFSQLDDAPDIRNTHTYLIGISDNPPLSFLNQEKKAAGFIVDLFAEIARQEKIEIQWVFDEWNILLEQSKAGEIDMLSSVGYSSERTKYFNYSQEGFITSWANIYLPQDSTITNFLELNMQTISVLKGDINGTNLVSRCERFEIKCSIKESNTYLELFNTIINGEADAVVANNIAGSWYANKYKVIDSSIIFNPSITYVVTPKKVDQSLMTLYDEYLKQWKADPSSIYYKTRSKWMLHQSNEVISIKTLLTIFGLALFGLLAFLAAMKYKKQVNRRVEQVSILNQQFSQIINLVPHMIYVTDSNGNIVIANKKASEYFGMTEEEIDRCNVQNLRAHVESAREFLNDNDLSLLVKGGELKEVETRDYLDRKYTFLMSKVPLKGMKNKQSSHVVVAVDITDIKAYQQQIIHMAQYDALTDLPNKVYFKSLLAKEINRFKKHQKQGAVLYLDMDSFKTINDSQGHQVGDMLIIEIASRLKQLIHEETDLAHFGGDEFIINLPNIDKNSRQAELKAKALGEIILESLAQPCIINEMVFQITASMGIMIYPRDGTTEQIILKRADIALNKAKHQGRNNVQLYDKQLELQVIHDHELETQLRHALKNNEFEIVYQPIIDGLKNKIVGVEALLRWNHPQKGLILPGNFIQVAEKNHFVIKLGNWVLEQACKKIHQEQQKGNTTLYIAVNVSAVQLKSKDFYANIVRLIEKYKIPANHLEFEITESVLMDDIELSITIFNKLKLLGITISIDDFGTGYSSFSYLIKLPIDKIKIDQSFVSDLPHNKNSSTIVKTIISMSDELGLKVVAEGIEKQGQYDFLLAKGCQYFQGYYLHKPMRYDEIINL